MTLIERLRALGQRREAEGIYTDQNICEAAIEEIERLRGRANSRNNMLIDRIKGTPAQSATAETDCDPQNPNRK